MTWQEWLFWRLELHPHIKSTLAEIRTMWTLADVFTAHRILDSLEEKTKDGGGA